MGVKEFRYMSGFFARVSKFFVGVIGDMGNWQNAHNRSQYPSSISHFPNFPHYPQCSLLILATNLPIPHIFQNVQYPSHLGNSPNHPERLSQTKLMVHLPLFCDHVKYSSPFSQFTNFRHCHSIYIPHCLFLQIDMTHNAHHRAPALPLTRHPQSSLPLPISFNVDNNTHHP